MRTLGVALITPPLPQYTTTGMARGEELPPPPPAPAMGTVRWGAPGGGEYPSGPPPPMSLVALGLSKATIKAFAAALQGVVTVGVLAKLPSIG